MQEKDSIVPPSNIPLWQALLAEFIGTFTLVFVGVSAAALLVSQGGGILTIGLAFGLVLGTMIYILGNYSGANFNPAVSFGFAVAGRMNWIIMLAYWIIQLIAGIAAAALVVYFFGTSTGAGASVGSLTYTHAWEAVLVEMIATFILVMTVLFVTRRAMLSPVAGIIIGSTLAFNIIAIKFLTGGSLNPARSLGPAIFSNNLGTYWIDLVGPLLGALLAALIYKLFTRNFTCCDKLDGCGNKILNECCKPIKECKRPKLDVCGREIKECGDVVYETYLE